MKILVSYRAIPKSPGWATGDMVVKAFRDLGHYVFPYAKYYQENHWLEPGLRLDSQSGEFDLMLFLECNDGDPQYFELLNLQTEHKACWLFDTSYYRDQCRGLIDFFKFDSIFLANPLTIRQHEQWGYDNVHYLPYACDPELHGRPLATLKVRDVALIGSVREDRLQLQSELKKRGIELEIIGGLFREQYVDALASTKIIVNQNPAAGLGLMNMRHFEAQAAGCVLFEQWNDLKLNIEAGLNVGGLVINYDGVPDLSNSHLAVEQDVMVACHQEFLSHHSYRRRCERILEIINGSH